MSDTIVRFFEEEDGSITRNPDYRSDYQANKHDDVLAVADLLFCAMENDRTYTPDEVAELYHMADIQHTLNKMVDKGLLFQHINDDGELVYSANIEKK
jgi:uncharacterized tellurite resistance protein B-like protein